MLRKILCDYELTYKGVTYRGMGLYLGDSTNPNSVKYKDFSGQVACLALKRTEEELAFDCKCKYWDINRNRLEAAGISFRLLEVYLYPKP